MPALYNFQWKPEDGDSSRQRLAETGFKFPSILTSDSLRVLTEFGSVCGRSPIAEAAAGLLCLVLLASWRLRREKNPRTMSVGGINRRRLPSSGSSPLRPSHDNGSQGHYAQQKEVSRRRARSRSGSLSSLDATISNEGEHDDLFDLLGVERASSLDNPMHRIKYYGPTQFSIVYESLAPPPSWLEVSRQVIPPDKHFQLQRYLALTIGESSSLRIHHTTHGHSAEVARAIAQRPVHSIPYATGDSVNQTLEKEPPVDLPLQHISLQVVPPMQSGVIQIYVKDSPREEWIEQTLPSAALAAQLQMDLLALQLLGPTIHNMFQAFQLIHQGSIAYKGKELVCHDKETIGNDPAACDDNLLAQCCYGIAWDDCLRCFGSAFPSLRLRLEALWWKHATEHDTKLDDGPSNLRNGDGNIEGFTALKPEYVQKRLLIGPVDFFRLFVPHLPDAAVPRDNSSRFRVEQMLRWRKRVAQASVLVNAYCEAKRVVNKGWVLSRSVPDNYWKRRMAFDDNMDNIRYDAAPEGKHTFYESTVSRDIVCQVRGAGFGLNRANGALSLTQAFSLVGIHTFRTSSNGQEPVLRPDEDPVLTIPSLRALIEAYPELEFFVSCTCVEAHGLWHVAVFVRALPASVDQSFDTALQRFKDGGPAERDNQLEVILHLGTTRDRLNWKAWLGVKFMSFLAVLTAKRDYPPLQKHIAGERTPLAALRLSSCGDVSHFGGSLQRHGLPSNYVAQIATLSSKKALTYAMRTVLFLIESSVFEHDVLDLSFVLAGSSDSELPERILGTYRMVQMKSVVPLPVSFLLPREREEVLSLSNRETSDEPNGVTLFLKLFITDPFLAAVDPMTRLLTSPGRERLPAEALVPLNTGQEDQRASHVVSSDPLEQAVNEMVKVLEHIQVPVRMDQLSRQNLSPDDAIATHEGFASIPAVRMLTRGDIRRCFVASRCSYSNTAMRLVEMLAWRARTFPIDMRSCRVELQNGQFFQQGRDKRGNPVFYFRSMLLGPWRKDENAAIAAVLARFDKAIHELDQDDVGIRCTLVVSLGKPHKDKKRKSRSAKSINEDEKEDGVESRAVSIDGNDSESVSNDGDSPTDVVSSCILSNPRVEPDEIWSLHSNKRLVRTLISILLDYYPERLDRAFVVVGHGNTAYARTTVGGLMRLSKYIRSARTRDKVKFLVRYSDLREYIEKEQLITFCGGDAPINPAAFECA